MEGAGKVLLGWLLGCSPAGCAAAACCGGVWCAHAASARLTVGYAARVRSARDCLQALLSGQIMQHVCHIGGKGADITVLHLRWHTWKLAPTHNPSPNTNWTDPRHFYTTQQGRPRRCHRQNMAVTNNISIWLPWNMTAPRSRLFRCSDIH